MLMFSLFLPIVTSFILALILGKFLIPFHTKLKMGNTEREELESHQSKAGTPSMGGTIFLLASFIVSCFYFSKYPNIIPIVLTTLLFGLIGYLDDYLKAKKRSSDGLLSWQKFLLQFLVTTGLGAYIYFLTDIGFTMYYPPTGQYISIGIWAIPIFYLAVMGTVNGVNFTDGVDGLASCVTVVVAFFFTCTSLFFGAGIEPITCALIGGLMGFLCYNLHPAKIFMGDTGSLALGGFVAACAYILHIPLFIIIIGLIYLVEVCSVIIQVAYFKITKKKYGEGRRIFKMAPIHHHFELSGWSETKVVGVFTIITIILCAFAYVLL